MVCPNCRSHVADGAAFCTNCGCKLAASVTPTPVSGGSYGGGSYGGGAYGAAPFRNSTWDGGVFETFVNSVAASLIMTLTCGIAMPWALCYMIKYIASHTIVDGKRLRFDGDGMSLFGNWIVWFLLTLVTCGIYGFWVTPKLYKWVASHVHFEN